MPSESIQVRMGLDARPFQAGLTKSKAAAMQFQQGLNKLGMGVGVLGLVALAKKAADAAAELKRTGEAVGLTVEEVQSLGFAASQNGSSIGEMNKALTRLSVNLGKANAGEAEAIRKFEDYGIAIRDAEGNLLSTSNVLDQIANRIQAAGGGADAAAIAFELLGKSGVGLVQTLGDGAEGLEKLKRLAMESGDVISTEANDAIVELTDTLNRGLGGALSFVTDKIGKMILGLKQLSVFAGELTSSVNIQDLAAAINNPIKALSVLAQMRENTAGAFNAAAQVAQQENAAAAIQVQVRNFEKLAPTLNKIANLEQKRREQLESSSEKISRLKSEEKELAELLKDKTDDQIRSDELLAKIKLDLLEKTAEREKAVTAQKERQNALQQQSMQLQKQLASQQRSLAQSKQDRSLFTLEELAGYNLNGFGSADVLEDARKARQVLALQTQAESARFDFGNVERSRELFGQADAIRKTISNLKSTERPFANMEEGIKSMREQIAALNEKAAGEGIILKKVVLQ